MKEKSSNTESRYQQVVRFSIVGIVANVFLAAFKAAAGILAGSIAVILDAVNSLTDAFASVATIIGEKIANMRPSKKFPYGYGRVEYVTSIVIAAIIIAAAVISGRESIMKIVHPSQPDYSAVTIIVLVVATVVKVFLGLAFVRRGKKINSQPLSASGIDALYDAILTFSTLLCAIVCLIWGVDLDGWVGLVISFFVLKAGIDVLREAISSIIGARPDPELSDKVRTIINSHDGVLGVYDLMMDSFGPESVWVTAHIEVPDEMTATQIHELTRNITGELYKEFNIVCTLGIYAANSTGEFADIHNKLNEIVMNYPEILQVHGFFVDKPKSQIDFDIVVDFHHDTDKVRNDIINKMQQLYPQYTFNVITDLDYSD